MILHAAKRDQDWQVLIPIYPMILVPLGILFPVPQDGFLVPKEMVCVHMHAHVCFLGVGIMDVRPGNT